MGVELVEIECDSVILVAYVHNRSSPVPNICGVLSEIREKLGLFRR